MNESNQDIGRRSAIKKAAAAGAIVWAAPTILSETVSASAPPCTPKCAPFLQPSFAVVVDLYCTGGASGQKSMFVRALNTGIISCPCGPANPAVDIIVSRIWRRHAPGGGPCVGNVTSNVFASECDDPNGSGVRGICVEGGSGSLPNGFYSGEFSLQVDCEDRSGNVYREICEYTACIDYQPSSGPCIGQTGVGGGIATLQRCVQVCNPA